MRPQPPSLHSNFFSSLKQVEKRLKLEGTSEPSQGAPSPPQLPTQAASQSCTNSSTESLSSPMYLHLDQLTNGSLTQRDNDSEPPRAFLSLSPQTHEDPSHEKPLGTIENENDDIDDIEKLMQLLDLSGGEKRRVTFDGGYDDNNDDSCHCEGGFLAKIAGVKGPKCKKEAKRLDSWIQHFVNGGEQGGKKEPLRLAHLLLGKAAFLSEGADYGFGGIEFPSTIEEFLHNDPPEVEGLLKL